MHSAPQSSAAPSFSASSSISHASGRRELADSRRGGVVVGVPAALAPIRMPGCHSSRVARWHCDLVRRANRRPPRRMATKPCNSTNDCRLSLRLPLELVNQVNDRALNRVGKGRPDGHEPGQVRVCQNWQIAFKCAGICAALKKMRGFSGDFHEVSSPVATTLRIGRIDLCRSARSRQCLQPPVFPGDFCWSLLAV
jgi:hypothetical protein